MSGFGEWDPDPQKRLAQGESSIFWLWASLGQRLPLEATARHQAPSGGAGGRRCGVKGLPFLAGTLLFGTIYKSSSSSQERDAFAYKTEGRFPTANVPGLAK